MTEEIKEESIVEEAIEQPKEVETNDLSNETKEETTDEEPTEEPVSVEGELPVQEDPEEELPAVEQFKAQLVQSLELNDQLITELEKHKLELSVFKELKTSMDNVLEEKEKVIEQLKGELEDVKMSKFNEKKSEIFELWMTKFKLTPEQSDSVQRMLAKFTSEAELEDLERMLSVKTGTPIKNPVALTQTSTQLSNTSSNEVRTQFKDLPQDQKLEYLWSQLPKTE